MVGGNQDDKWHKVTTTRVVCNYGSRLELSNTFVFNGLDKMLGINLRYVHYFAHRGGECSHIRLLYGDS